MLDGGKFWGEIFNKEKTIKNLVGVRKWILNIVWGGQRRPC